MVTRVHQRRLFRLRHIPAPDDLLSDSGIRVAIVRAGCAARAVRWQFLVQAAGRLMIVLLSRTGRGIVPAAAVARNNTNDTATGTWRVIETAG
jgi:hypothetical protein